MAKAAVQVLAEPNAESEPTSAKRTAILDGAARVFLALGYGAASMDSVAREARVSKQTVYAHFGAKDTLFEEIIRQKCDELLAPIPDMELDGGDPALVLTDLARLFMNAILTPENMQHFRAIVAESTRFPELAEAFYRAGPRAAADRLAVYLSEMAAAGRLRVDDPVASAELFFGMMRADLYMRRVLDLEKTPNAKEVERHVARAVRTFMAGHEAQ